MATLVSRGVEGDYAFYRVSRTLSYLASDGGSRVKQEVIEHLVSIYPNLAYRRHVRHPPILPTLALLSGPFVGLDTSHRWSR
ncbi:hypothetical protein LXA43DRAFT_238379 [Ganoderma leucocontextum]|nr:hypothetical protein LXA43DRAFT_238379 [Ganoderma leucocontextum]